MNEKIGNMVGAGGSESKKYDEERIRKSRVYEGRLLLHRLDKGELDTLRRTVEEIDLVGLDNIRAEIISRDSVYPLKATSGMIRIGLDRAKDELYITGFDGYRQEKLAQEIGKAIGISRLHGRIVR